MSVLSENGKYSVWYHTSRGESSGILHLQDGKISGRGTALSYKGSYVIDGDHFTATIQTWRHAEQPSTVGVDVMEIVVTGKAPQGKIVASCTGYAKQVPDLLFDVTLVRISDDESPGPKR